MNIKKNIKKIINEIPSNITIVAATKTRTIEEIKKAIDNSITIIGENYVQEAEKKYQELKGKAMFHLIGHLQTNKVKKALKIFDMIQTLDSLKLAKEINKIAKKPINCLIEVNIGKEESKIGAMPEKVIDLINESSKLNNIKIKGLMTMAPYFKDAEKTRPYFKEMKKLFDSIHKLNVTNVDMEILSMGMSHSYKVAIEEGANMIRLGTAIFGEKDL